ncbi:hypothetical protein [Streptomyces nigra]
MATPAVVKAATARKRRRSTSARPRSVAARTDYERWKVKTAANRVQREAAERALARYADQAAKAKRELLHHRDAIREGGGTPPHLPSQLADIDPPDTDPTEENDL